MAMREQLTAEHFRPHLHRVWRIRGGRHALVLTEVDVPPGGAMHPPVTGRQPFTLIFSGPPGDVLPEGLHTLEAEDGVCFELYVMPVQTPSRDRQDYQAVFN